ncbi:MAG TPA: N,N-dimethylformamidase beta subunit family domain-containing protein [Ktedonobacterales bacterium]
MSGPLIGSLAASQRTLTSRLWMRFALICLAGALTFFGCASSVSQTPQPSLTPTSPFTPCQRAFEDPNPVASENTCPGTRDWRQNLPLGADHAIEGYVSPTSAQAGDAIKLYVSTSAATYTYAVYRLGYYQGTGGRLIYQSPTITGIQQPAPTVDPITRTVECSWSNPATIFSARSWVSGIYLVKLVSADGNMRYTFFVLRNTTVRTPILYVAPFLTYQAYNLWGGFSLYRGTQPDGVTLDPTLRSYAVSFDRPFPADGMSTMGLYDLPLLSWMESQSYNMSYAADFDLDSPTQPLTTHRLIVISGHTEYWSTGMRQSVTAARDAGVSLAFFGANDVYWHVRLASSQLGLNRVVVCYKDAKLDPLAPTQPLAATVRWRDAPLNQPEQSLLGEAYGGAISGAAPLTLGDASGPYLNGSSLKSGSSLNGLIGGEYDRLYPNNAPANVQIIAASTVHCIPTSLCPTSGVDTANATMYASASGAIVFDAGTFQWSWGLSPLGANETIQTENSAQFVAPGLYVNADFQRVTANIVSALMR